MQGKMQQPPSVELEAVLSIFPIASTSQGDRSSTEHGEANTQKHPYGTGHTSLVLHPSERTGDDPPSTVAIRLETPVQPETERRNDRRGPSVQEQGLPDPGPALTAEDLAGGGPDPVGTRDWTRDWISLEAPRLQTGATPSWVSCRLGRKRWSRESES